eukprot:gnl/TRDRNA2_/TRDRNA2_178924_c0_seq1.p1 gnl/TRDRNA2_/TRDRNA2_178924_c0~~gnl/TRDRNA2_/TRDRNA2_178924_c0_seq1.p1  ORF type:complete len:254 (-),score=49.03 gnl/TRDRNA2_/TRDRNA2_178924_c0_seq1:88-849(-)
MSAESQFNQDGNKHRTTIYDQICDGRKRYPGNLNFAAYRQGADEQYLGIISGTMYYAKPWGNDSSNIQSILNGPAYWKRVYYRPDVAARFAEQDRMAEIQRAAEERTKRAAEAASQGRAMTPSDQGSPGKIKKSASDPGLLPSLPQEKVEDGFDRIRAKMGPYVEKGGKPRLRKMETGERLNFWNTLDHKYQLKAGGKNLKWNTCKQAHRSSKNEIIWMMSNYQRTDTTAVLSGYGSEVLGGKKAEAEAAKAS